MCNDAPHPNLGTKIHYALQLFKNISGRIDLSPEQHRHSRRPLQGKALLLRGGLPSNGNLVGAPNFPFIWGNKAVLGSSVLFVGN